jgi:hypothetical protein
LNQKDFDHFDRNYQRHFVVEELLVVVVVVAAAAVEIDRILQMNQKVY